MESTKIYYTHLASSRYATPHSICCGPFGFASLKISLYCRFHCFLLMIVVQRDAIQWDAMLLRVLWMFTILFFLLISLLTLFTRNRCLLILRQMRSLFTICYACAPNERSAHGWMLDPHEMEIVVSWLHAVNTSLDKLHGKYSKTPLTVSMKLWNAQTEQIFTIYSSWRTSELVRLVEGTENAAYT